MVDRYHALYTHALARNAMGHDLAVETAQRARRG
jgi:hypothetical protein